MNITKLFEAQAKLDARILEQHPIKDGEDRLVKKILALMTELNELANEWRGFKFWSTNNKPRTTLACEICRGAGGHYNTYENAKNKINKIPCKYCKGTGTQVGINPLQEEFVDCLHFIISIGLELGVQSKKLLIAPSTENISSEMFLSIMNDVLTLDLRRTESHYQYTFARITELGLALGFTPNDIEQAYYSKNKINHERQENNY